MKPRIAITMGDPAGVGPELILAALSDRRVMSVATPFVIGDAGFLEFMAKRLGLKMVQPSALISLSDISPKTIKPGSPTKESGQAMIRYVEEAVCMAEAGVVDAVVTAPISKEAAKKAGFKFPGHTEFIAHLTGCKDFRMMLGGHDLKVVLVTIHEPLSKIPRLITRENVFMTIKIAHEALKRDFGLRSPRIAVAGLNPHAGEGGMFGYEERRVILPVVKKAAGLGIRATGPLPPDTVFYRAVRKKEFDCVVCMYHDQGLGPLKLLHFEDGVNVTLGLPIIRTSVDHGTAYDIAWKGKASMESLVAAIEMAALMSRARARQRIS